MSNTDDTIEERRRITSTEARGIAGLVRHMAIKLTEGVIWRVVGHILLDNKTKETKDANLFGAIGFHSRPKAGANAEALVVHPGGAANPAIVGTRDEDTRKRVAKLDQDETATFNSLTIVHHTNEGFVEIRTPSGAAFALPTMAEYNALRTAFNTHTHPYLPGPGAPAPTGTATSLTSTIPVPVPTGTPVLKA